MKRSEYDFERNECINNSCYRCYCNGIPICFKSNMQKVIKDFPNREFEQLTEQEKIKVLGMECPR